MNPASLASPASPASPASLAQVLVLARGWRQISLGRVVEIHGGEELESSINACVVVAHLLALSFIGTIFFGVNLYVYMCVSLCQMWVVYLPLKVCVCVCVCVCV